MFVVRDYNGRFLSGESSDDNLKLTYNKYEAMLFVTADRAREAVDWASKKDPDNKYFVKGAYI